MHCAARLQGRAAALLFQRFRTALINGTSGSAGNTM